MISYFKNASSNFFFIVGVDVEKVEFLTSLFQAHRYCAKQSEEEKTARGWGRARELSLFPSFFSLALLLHYSETSPLGHLCSFGPAKTPT